MLNRITITGRLTADPELRQTESGKAVTSFSIACQRNYKNDSNEYDADFFDIVAWRGNAEFVVKYFSKASLITVDGRLQSRKYTDKNGNKRVAIEIIAENVHFGDSKSNNGGQNTPGGSFASDPSDIAITSDFTPEFSIIDDEDDFPFPPFSSI